MKKTGTDAIRNPAAYQAHRRLSSLKFFALHHLAEEFRGFTDISDELIEYRTHPERNQDMVGRQAFCETYLMAELRYLREIIDTVLDERADCGKCNVGNKTGE